VLSVGCGVIPEVSLGDGPLDATDEPIADAVADASDGAPDDVLADSCAIPLDPSCDPFGPPELVQELSSGAANGYDEDPTLTSDMLEIYFLSTRDGGPGHGDVWTSIRASADASWGVPTLVQSVSSPDRETSPAVTFDGLGLYVASDRDGGQGGYDIWMSSRAGATSDWSAPVLVTELNTAGDDIPRPPGNHSLAIPVSYRISVSYEYQIYMAYRASAVAGWSTPTLLTWVDTANLDVDGFLSDDALSFALSSDRLNAVGKQDLFLASRTDSLSAFGTPVTLASLNTDTSREAHPWVSPDLHEVYFDSDRSGVPRIYHATR
jgi:hypothetical protein